MTGKHIYSTKTYYSKIFFSLYICKTAIQHKPVYLYHTPQDIAGKMAWIHNYYDCALYM